MFAVQAQHHEIRTVEGLRRGEELHPLQESFIRHHALQCGDCTPGFLMLAVGALEHDPNIGDEELLELLSSICADALGTRISSRRCAAAEELRATQKATTSGL